MEELGMITKAQYSFRELQGFNYLKMLNFVLLFNKI